MTVVNSQHENTNPLKVILTQKPVKNHYEFMKTQREILCES